MSELQSCCRCNANPLTKQGGVIFIRAKNKEGRWDSLPICVKCWNIENPSKKAVEI